MASSAVPKSVYENDKVWVFLADPVYVDFDVYAYWLGGSNAAKAAKVYREDHQQIAEDFDAGAVEAHFHDQYRVFQDLDAYMAQPTVFEKHRNYQIHPKLVVELIERYYQFTDVFARELIGKRPNNKMRDTMEDVATRVGIPVVSCRRQFENLRRIYKRVISMNHGTQQSPLLVTDRIISNFRLSTKLTLQYIRLIFLIYHKIDYKKKLNFATYADLDRFAQILLPSWSVLSQADNPTWDVSKVWSVQFHPKFVSRLRDFKTLATSTRDVISHYTATVKTNLEKQWADRDSKKLEALDTRLTGMVKFLFNLAGNLSQPKQVKDLWTEVIENLADPCKKIELSEKELRQVFDVFRASIVVCVEALAESSQRNRAAVIDAWERFITGIRDVIAIVYERL